MTQKRTAKHQHVPPLIERPEKLHSRDSLVATISTDSNNTHIQCSRANLWQPNQTMTAIRIGVPLQEWARHNKVMIELLRALKEHDNDGLSTMQLLQKVNRTHNAQEMIKRAEQYGYIKRVSKAPKTKGNWLVINYLTPKGKQLLDKLSM
jgi:hypothetical protein